ncbi:MAG: ArsA-related P-loop ATPase, partial [Solirubrobacteraceae bacterium]|nr:ArsA-related P-loop ATPase [Solirubrobacteraceae bacterium]
MGARPRRLLSMPPPPPSAASSTHQAGERAPLPQSKLVLVTGKGGVGRSSTATAIAVDLAALGRTVALVHAVDAPPVEPPRDAARGLVVIPLDRDHALSNYLGDQLPGPFAAALRASRAFKLVTAATPGLAELLTIGELKRLADRYDHLVFDAPATGHLLALLDAPGRFERAAAVGPIARRASDLGKWIVDPQIVSVVAVTTGDGLAVSEMLELVDTLEERLGRPP